MRSRESERTKLLRRRAAAMLSVKLQVPDSQTNRDAWRASLALKRIVDRAASRDLADLLRYLEN